MNNPELCCIPIHTAEFTQTTITLSRNFRGRTDKACTCLVGMEAGRKQTRKSVAVIGAGVSGLVAAK